MIVFQHGRADWVDPRYPVTGPTFNWDTIEWVVLHYTAAVDLIDGDVGEFKEQLPAYFRAIHRDYLNRQPIGYSIGYNAAVDWLGGTWELRGDTFKAAANANPSKPGDENAKTFAILMLVDGQDAATPLAAAAVRGLVAQIREQKPNVIILGHRDVDATQCPGHGVYSQIVGGVFEPDAQPDPPPDPPPEPPPPDPVPDPPVPDPEENDVKLYIGRDKRDGQILISIGGVCYRRVKDGADENGVKSRMDAGVGPTYFHPKRADEQVTDFAAIPELEGAWVVAMGVELAESKS